MRITVAEVITTHGIRGNVKVRSFSDNEKRFEKGSKVYIGDELLTIEDSFDQKGLKVLKFVEYNDINDSIKLVGKDITIDEKDRGVLSEGEFYIYELIGLDVYSKGQIVGKVKDVISGVYPNDVYVIEKKDNKEVLLPALKTVITNVDINNKKIEVDNLSDYE
ncbi:ribosome maturation factor RimM [uncultured Anaerococcus sp.]|uniref:ribosome maturation factor RimM n=1 Tax=uncultured Anaerococcus sp. TaxID=293428 RepID=UPI002618B594|nr:ribosome maturation factor RimM [uncultured Anaerococcus sp.]